MAIRGTAVSGTSTLAEGCLQSEFSCFYFFFLSKIAFTFSLPSLLVLVF